MKTLKRATLLQWSRGGSDRRYEASSLATIEIVAENPVAVAREFDSGNDCPDESDVGRYVITAMSMDDGYYLATGHGVTVQYPSGARREVRAT